MSLFENRKYGCHGNVVALLVFVVLYQREKPRRGGESNPNFFTNFEVRIFRTQKISKQKIQQTSSRFLKKTPPSFRQTHLKYSIGDFVFFSVKQLGKFVIKKNRTSEKVRIRPNFPKVRFAFAFFIRGTMVMPRIFSLVTNVKFIELWLGLRFCLVLTVHYLESLLNKTNGRQLKKGVTESTPIQYQVTVRDVVSLSLKL